MIVLTPNEYLDLRRPEWLDVEVSGHVRYVDRTHLIHVHDPDIERIVRECVRG